MRRSIQLFSMAAFIASVALPAVAAECVMPPMAPAMPQGATATKDEMLAGKAALQKYINALQDFQDCEETRIKGSPKGTKKGTLQEWRDAGNAAIDAANAQQAVFSAQLKAFNARQH